MSAQLTPEQMIECNAAFNQRLADGFANRCDGFGFIDGWAHQQAKIDALQAELRELKELNAVNASGADHALDALEAVTAERDAALLANRALIDHNNSLLLGIDGYEKERDAALLDRDTALAKLDAESNEFLTQIAQYISERDKARLERDALQSRVELLEHDSKSGDYETLYAQTVEEVKALQFKLDELAKQEPMKRYVYRTKTIEAYTFDEFVEFGRKAGANIVNGMPWSFKFKDRAVTHENDNRYLIQGVKSDLHRGCVVMVMADGWIQTEGEQSFLKEYMPVYLNAKPVPASPQPAYREGCNYLAMQGTVCNKCGEIHQ